MATDDRDDDRRLPGRAAGTPRRRRHPAVAGAATALLDLPVQADLAGLGHHQLPVPGAVPGRHGPRARARWSTSTPHRGRRAATSTSSPRASWPSTAMQIGANEAMYPVMGAIKWIRTYFAMLATPLAGRSTCSSATWRWIAVRLAIVSRDLPGGHGRLRDGRTRRWPSWPCPPACSPAWPSPPRSPPSPPPRTNDTGFSTIYRFGLIPLFLFSGHLLPGQPAAGLAAAAGLGHPLYHGVALCRGLVLGHLGLAIGRSATSAYLVALTAVGLRRWPPHLSPKAGRVIDTVPPSDGRRRAGPVGSGRRRAAASRPWPCSGRRRARRLVERNILVYRRGWILLGLGLLRALLLPAVHRRRASATWSARIHVDGQRRALHRRSWRPGLLASSAMNGATARLHLQHLLQAEDRQDLRRRAVDAARRRRRGPGRAHVVADAGPVVLGGVPGRHGRARATSTRPGPSCACPAAC